MRSNDGLEFKLVQAIQGQGQLVLCLSAAFLRGTLMFTGDGADVRLSDLSRLSAWT